MERTASRHAGDELATAMSRTGTCACVGLDPVLDRIPDPCRSDDPVASLRTFCLSVIDAVAEHVCCIKAQSACFERHGPRGLALLDEVYDVACARELPVILDAKRGDIGISAAHYAAAAFARRPGGGAPRWLTVNGYLGPDTLEAMLGEGGVFVLVRTSNAGSDEVQGLVLEDGRTVAEAMADVVASLAADRIGASGWSDVGAVVGATHPEHAGALRARMPGVVLLVPGIGAQGGHVEDCRALCGDDGRGAVLTASRSVIYAGTGDDWAVHVADAAARLADEAGCMAGLR